MLEKTLKSLKSFKTAKRTAVFLAVFALTVAVMCASFTEVRGETPKITETSETALTNVKVESLETGGATGAADAKQTADPVYTSSARNIPAVQAVAVDYQREETDVQAKPVQIKLSSTSMDPEDELAMVIKTLQRQTTGAGQSVQGGEFVYCDKIPLSYELQKYTFDKCSERGLEYELILAVMWRESRFTLDAVNLNANGTTDSGLMQINDVNRGWLHERHGIDDLMDPYQNIDAGTAILANLHDKYGEHGAMLAYQYGEAGMVRKVSQGQTTSAAVEAAYRQRDYYRELI